MEKSQIGQIENGYLTWLWGPSREEAITSVLRFAQRSIEDVIREEPQHWELAKRHAEQIVQAQFNASGWDVSVTWDSQSSLHRHGVDGGGLRPACGEGAMSSHRHAIPVVGGPS
jgi:hypothetical protein